MKEPLCFITRFIPQQLENGITAQEIKDASSVASFKYQLNRVTRNRAPLSITQMIQDKDKFSMQDNVCNAALYRKNIKTLSALLIW